MVRRARGSWGRLYAAEARVAPALEVLSAEGAGSAIISMNEEHEAPSQPHWLKILLCSQAPLF